VWIDFVCHCVKITYSLINLACSWMWPSRDHKDVLCAHLPIPTVRRVWWCFICWYITHSWWRKHIGLCQVWSWRPGRCDWPIMHSRSSPWLQSLNEYFSFALSPVALQRTVKSSSFCYRNCARWWSYVFPTFFIITNYSAWQPGRLYLKLH